MTVGVVGAVPGPAQRGEAVVEQAAARGRSRPRPSRTRPGGCRRRPRARTGRRRGAGWPRPAWPPRPAGAAAAGARSCRGDAVVAVAATASVVRHSRIGAAQNRWSTAQRADAPSASASRHVAASSSVVPRVLHCVPTTGTTASTREITRQHRGEDEPQGPGLGDGWHRGHGVSYTNEHRYAPSGPVVIRRARMARLQGPAGSAMTASVQRARQIARPSSSVERDVPDLDGPALADRRRHRGQRARRRIGRRWLAFSSMPTTLWPGGTESGAAEAGRRLGEQGGDAAVEDAERLVHLRGHRQAEDDPLGRGLDDLDVEHRADGATRRARGRRAVKPSGLAYGSDRAATRAAAYRSAAAGAAVSIGPCRPTSSTCGATPSRSRRAAMRRAMADGRGRRRQLRRGPDGQRAGGDVRRAGRQAGRGLRPVGHDGQPDRGPGARPAGNGGRRRPPSARRRLRARRGRPQRRRPVRAGRRR